MIRKDYTHDVTKKSACHHLADDEEFVRRLVQETLNEVLESEMTEFLGAGKSERTQTRQGYRSGYYRRDLTMKVGEIELRVPQERSGQFSTRVFERYQRSEKALVAVLSEMYVQGVSTRRVSRLAEGLCGHEFSPATISAMVSKLDASLKAFAERRLEEAYPYVLLDARYEKVREEGSVRSRAVQIALGIDGEGRRQVLAAEVANRESEGSWTEFLSHLKERDLRGVEYVVSDSHEGLKHAISKVLPTALWQRCCVHFLRNARDKLSRSADPACLEGLKRLWGCEHVGEAREALGAWVARWGDEKGFGRLVEWVEDHVEKTLTVYRLPREHRLRMKSTNMLERYNEELRRRTRVVRIFPNAESCLRLILALAAETHERWLTGQRYLYGQIRRGSRLRTGIRDMAGGGMKRPKISRRAETRPYGRVSAPTGNCRKFLTQLHCDRGVLCQSFRNAPKMMPPSFANVGPVQVFLLTLEQAVLIGARTDWRLTVFCLIRDQAYVLRQPTRRWASPYIVELAFVLGKV